MNAQHEAYSLTIPANVLHSTPFKMRWCLIFTPPAACKLKKYLHEHDETGNIHEVSKHLNFICVFHDSFKGGSMVSLTSSAVQKFKEVVEQQGAPGDGVRIFLMPGG